jgi:hypothetical protein
MCSSYDMMINHLSCLTIATVYISFPLYTPVITRVMQVLCNGCYYFIVVNGIIRNFKLMKR